MTNGSYYPGFYYIGKQDPAFPLTVAWTGFYRPIPPGARFPYGELVFPD